MHKTNVIKFLFLFFLLCSCSRETYLFENDLRKSKFILKNTKFKYIENSNAGSFKYKGTFIRTDSSYIFNFNKSEKLPFSYATRDIEIISSNDTGDLTEITVIDTFDNFPETSTDVLLRDKNLKTLRILKTDANGKVQFKNSINIYEIEIASNTGYNRNAILRYKFLRGKNALVRLKLIEYGGEPVDGGPHGWSYYFEPIIEYEMIKKNNKIIAVKLNDFSYNRVK